MSDNDVRKDAIAMINMFNYLERELRVSLDDRHLASLSRAIADELAGRYGASDDEVTRLLKEEPSRVEGHSKRAFACRRVT